MAKHYSNLVSRLERKKVVVTTNTGKAKVALITDVAGQDDTHFVEFLLDKGYEVHAIKRRSSPFNTDFIDQLAQDAQEEGRKFILHQADLTDSGSLIRLVKNIEPDEIYNLASQAYATASFDEPEYAANADGVGALRILEAIRTLGLERKTRYFQASTSELYGLVQDSSQKEIKTNFPTSPYAVAKLYAYLMTVNYRKAHGIYACNGTLFNHESPARGESFFVQEISRGISRIALGLQESLSVGNLSAVRDCGHPRDYVEMQWLMMQQEKAEDLVIATGVQYTIRQFVELAAQELGIKLRFEGQGEEEVGIVDAVTRKGLMCKVGDVIVKVNGRYYRPTENEPLLADPAKTHEKLGWKPKTTLQELVKEMVSVDFYEAKREALAKLEGMHADDNNE